MRTLAAIPPAVTRLQAEVSNPEISAFVAANAGAGKTHVLAQRVVNLLLSGVEPGKILCLTFTKAAAANMAKRVFDTLARWTTLDDVALDEAIRERSGMPADAVRRALARRLFARALETPGGLKVQTIHAFCAQLLHQFPFEANVSARFAVLDDTEQTQLLEQLTLLVLLDGAANPGGPLGRALADAMTAAADQTFRDVVRETIGQRDAIVSWVVSAGGVGPAVAGLSRALGIDPSDTLARVDAEFFSGSAIAPQEWPVIAATLAQGSKNDNERARCFAALPALSGADRVDMYLDIFCTGDRNARKSIVTRAIKDAALVERLYAEQSRVCALLERRRSIACRDRSAALLTVTYEVLARYQTEKERHGLVDYDDLIDKALDLLRDVGAAWVHYKLDLGIDHLLIDEAQDTSSKQWEIVRRLTAEFTAGAGARPGTRTIFAVGDEKQSIYSFQNAAPKDFAAMRRYFERMYRQSGLGFLPRELEHSFRSGESVLGAVDIVFKSVAASVTSDAGGFPPHIALPDAPPGVVEIWEPEQPDERPPIEGWDAPFDRVNETSPRVKLAQKIARTVRRLVDGRQAVGIERRPARYGDVLILVRQRGELFEAIIRALKNENVEVAGADRLVLTDHIAVMDLMVLADALVLAEDDLALATALRSPLFGFSDDDLFAVAYGRGRASLRATLHRKAAERPLFAAAAARLAELSAAAQIKTPFAFFADVLGAGGGRRDFLARLGAEANDALDEFLALALDYERRQTPSLQGFLAWLREARAEIKRDMEIARDEVRVMTVHGAKGLEAPIVILADTMTPLAGPRPARLLPLAGGALVWAGRKDDDGPAVAAARADARSAAEDEYRRLLYVALTRAADRLIVCGAEGVRKRPDGCWYDLVRGPLGPFLVEEGDGGETILRYRKPAGPPDRQPAALPAAEGKSAPRPALPAWLRQPAPEQPPLPAPLAPSSAFEGMDFAPGAASALARQKALERGRLVHRLMQSLPDIPPERRAAAAESYLARAAANFSAEERRDIVRKILDILGNRNFAQLFASGSRPEVPIVGRIPRAGGDPVLVSGQVDRLAVLDDAVLVADYKTDRRVPSGTHEIEPYVAQLALYGAVLSQLYSDKPVRAALVFAEGPLLMEVSAELMQTVLGKVLARAKSPQASVTLQ
jgi:ATP-dependent helicase/nuclease subunit A